MRYINKNMEKKLVFNKEETLNYFEQTKRRQLEKLTEAGFTKKQAECLLEIFEDKNAWSEFF